MASTESRRFVRVSTYFFLWAMLIFPGWTFGEDVRESDNTRECLDCHASLHPGIVAGWQNSRHYRFSPAEGIKKAVLERRISTDAIPAELLDNTVGCYECHSLKSEKHKDTFEHNGYRIHLVVTPEDCSTCHIREAEEYGENLMSHAYGNLVYNSVYKELMRSTNHNSPTHNSLSQSASDLKTAEDSCLHCHGTSVKVTGSTTRKTDFGEMKIPTLSGWPNQGVGRINPDGSKGSCSACHVRHSFSIETARKPHTCSQCHKGPDVPAYKVYNVSKHGNIYSSSGNSWNFSHVPWVVGKDFNAPTCAVCHISLLTSEDGEVIAKRSHRMSDRVPWRIFGLIYAHAHPKSPDTTIIKNRAGLPLPTELTGEPAEKYLISEKEQAERRKNMKNVCLSCHGRGWVDGHFVRFENTIKTSNDMTFACTKILLSAWEKGAAKGPEQKDSIFNEVIERKWVEQWLFYANSTRFASAMGGADYGVFADGRWRLSGNLQEMREWLDFHLGKEQ